MSLRKPLSLVVLAALALLAACSEVTGPQTEGFCTVNGGPGTCPPGVTAVSK
jgi:hypothetical protein